MPRPLLCSIQLTWAAKHLRRASNTQRLPSIPAPCLFFSFHISDVEERKRGTEGSLALRMHAITRCRSRRNSRCSLLKETSGHRARVPYTSCRHTWRHVSAVRPCMKLLNGDEQVRSPEWLRLEPMPPSPLLHPYKISADLVWKRAKNPWLLFPFFFFPLYLIYLCTVGT